MFFYLVGTTTDKNEQEKGFVIKDTHDLRNKNTFLDFVRAFLLLNYKLFQTLQDKTL